MTSFSYVATALVVAAVLPITLHGFQPSPFQRTTLQKSTTSSSSSSSSQLFSSPVAEESITTAASSSLSSAQQQQQQQQPPDMQAYSNGYKTVFTEISCELSSPTHGTLPSDLRGTYYKCGPAMFSAGSLLPPKNSLVKPLVGNVFGRHVFERLQMTCQQDTSRRVVTCRQDMSKTSLKS